MPRAPVTSYADESIYLEKKKKQNSTCLPYVGILYFYFVWEATESQLNTIYDTFADNNWI